MPIFPPRTGSAVDVLIIDDHTILREGLTMLLSAKIADLRITALGSLEAALAHEGDPAIILLDIRLPGIDGLTGLPLLQRHWPEAHIVVLSSMDDAPTRQQALSRGASAFVAKSDAGEALVQAVVALLQRQPMPAPQPSRLTQRQQEVLALLGRGLSNKGIAKQLDLSEHTIRRHLQDIFAHLQVGNRTEAVVEARRHGLIA